MGKSSKKSTKSKSPVRATAGDMDSKQGVKSPASSVGGSPTKPKNEEQADREGPAHVSVLAEGSVAGDSVARSLLLEIEEEAMQDPKISSMDVERVPLPSPGPIVQPPTPLTKAVNAMPVRYDPTEPEAVPARMIEVIMAKHEAFRHLKVTQCAVASDVRDPGFAAMTTADQALAAIINLFNTAGYSVAMTNQSAVLACGLRRLSAGGQAIYDLFLRHQWQRKLEKATASKGELLETKDLQRMAELYIGHSKDEVHRMADDLDLKDSMIKGLEGALQNLAEEKERLASEAAAAFAAAMEAERKLSRSTSSIEPTGGARAFARSEQKPSRGEQRPPSVKFESKDVQGPRTPPPRTEQRDVIGPKIEFSSSDYLADIYDECVRQSATTINATTRFRQSAVSELKTFDGRTRDEFRGKSWLSSDRSAFRRDGISAGEACLQFPELLSDRAKLWYKQVEREVRVNWPALQKEFEDEYCGGLVTPHRRYYDMRRKPNEDAIDYLYRLNVQAREVGIDYKKADEGWAHVQHFYDTCDDPELALRLGVLDLTRESQLRRRLKEIQRQGARVKREESQKTKAAKPRETRDYTRDDRAAKAGTRSKPIVVNAVKSGARPSAGYESDSYSSDGGESDDRASEFELSGTESDGEDRGVGADQGVPQLADEAAAILSKIFAASQVKEIKTKPASGFDRPQRQVEPCTHCGSQRHRDRDCWRRLTCQTCGRTGHPSEHCYQQCKGCGKVHDRGKCPLEEIANNLRAWYDPTKHAGLLPASIEKWLN